MLAASSVPRSRESDPGDAPATAMEVIEQSRRITSGYSVDLMSRAGLAIGLVLATPVGGLEQLLPEDGQSSSVQALEGGRWIFAGSLREQLEPGLFLFDAGVPLLLFTDQEPPLTRSVRVVTAPPLFGIPLAG